MQAHTYIQASRPYSYQYTMKHAHTVRKTLLTNANPHRKGTYESIHINENGIHTYANSQIHAHAHSYTNMHLYMWAKMPIH